MLHKISFGFHAHKTILFDKIYTHAKRGKIYFLNEVINERSMVLLFLNFTGFCTNIFYTGRALYTHHKAMDQVYIEICY